MDLYEKRVMPKTPKKLKMKLDIETKGSVILNLSKEEREPKCKFHSKFPPISQTCFHFFNGESGCKIVA